MRYFPTIDWVRWMIAPALIFIVADLDRNYQTDFWHHLARGREIALRGELVDRDLFTFTIAGAPLRDANWVMQVIYYRLFASGGLSLVQFANAAVLAIALLIVVRTCRAACGSIQAAALAGIGVFVGLWPLLLIRPQSVSFLIFALLHSLLRQVRTTRHAILLPPILMALWANVHGGFAIGLVLIAAFTAAAVIEWAMDLIRHDRKAASAPQQVSHAPPFPGRHLLILVLSFAATLLNPYGIAIYRYAAGITQRATSRQIEEWLPPSLGSGIGICLLVSLGGLATLYWIARRRPSVRELSLMLCFLPLACRSMRMVAWWYLAMAPTFAELLVGARKQFADERPRVASWTAAAAVALLIIACGISLPWAERFNPVLGSIRANHRIESDLQSVSPNFSHRLFTRLEWGEYFDWSLGARHALFIDGRIEAYPNSVWQDYRTITSAARGWQELLDRYCVDCLVLDTAYHDRLLPDVRRSGIWLEMGRSGSAVVFVRRPRVSILSVASP